MKKTLIMCGWKKAKRRRLWRQVTASHGTELLLALHSIAAEDDPTVEIMEARERSIEFIVYSKP